MSKLSKELLQKAHDDAEELAKKYDSIELRPPEYDSNTYHLDITRNPYFDALILLRHYIKRTSDEYFSNIVGAKNVDLFMLTPSVSSPMGYGSDSEAVPIKFGNQLTYLVDSSQFGFEPLLFQGNNKLYCYLPSMRGEDPDERHLNQFYHCEAEILGTLEELIPIIEGYIMSLTEACLALLPLIKKMAIDASATENALRIIFSENSFERCEFDKVFKDLALLKESEDYISQYNYGRKISSEGEREYAKRRGVSTPFWLCNFDRDMTAFYQKPIASNPESVITSDLIFPPLTPQGLSGEIVGSGQRQNLPEEMYESLKRQGVNSEAYEWYIDLRRQNSYRITSGFGMGIERFIAWMLGYNNIRDVIPYPRLKNVKTMP